MKSSFSRMFQYAKQGGGAGQSEALEDFSTEVLALAINSEPTPMMRALKTIEGLSGLGGRLRVIGTQVQKPCGRLDMVLRAELDGQEVTIWVEVKVMAGVSGDQLNNYLAFIASRPTDARPVLITLGGTRLDPRLEHLHWQTISELIEPGDNPNWQELQVFLEEFRIVARPHVSGSVEQVQALLGAFSPLANRRLQRLYPALGSAFPEGGALWRQLSDSSKKDQKWTMALHFRPKANLVGCGVDGRGLGMWVHSDLKWDRRRDVGLREALMSEYGGLNSEIWLRDDAHPYTALSCHTPFEGLSQRDALRWLEARFDELCETRVWALLWGRV